MGENNTISKKVAASVAAVTAAGMLLSGALAAPDDLNKVSDLPPAQQSYVEMLVEDTPDEGDEEEEMPVTVEKKKIGAGFKERFLALPEPVRALISLPIWLLGRLLIAVIVPLAQNVLTPLGCVVLKYICIAALSLVTILAAVKAVNPDIPLGRIINKRSILWTAAASALFGLIGTLLERFCPEGMRIYTLTEGVLILSAIVIITFRLTSILKRKRHKKSAAV